MTDDNLISQQLDEYRLEALLGQGGMARVYRALDVRLQRYAAIKVIDVPLRTDVEYTERFEREAQAIARLEHPNIVRLYRYGEAQDVLYMAMQYIEGTDLAFVLRSYHDDHEFIEPEEALRITREVCLALDYAHNKGIIHRDVKPSNIMLDKQGQAYLADFGLALLIEVGTRGEIFGSPHYIAPEQAISSAGAVPQSDLYAVGIILYEMFTGQYPFDADTPMDIAMMHMSDPPPLPRDIRPEVSPELEGVILKAIEKEPAKRYPNGTALVEALEQALLTSQSPDPAPAATTLPRKSILERVAVDLAANPLPPIPAEVAIPKSAPTLARPVSAPPPPITGPLQGRQARTRTPIYVGAVVVALFAIAVVVLALLLSRDNSDDDGSTGLSQTDAGTELALASELTETTTASIAETQDAAVVVVPTLTVTAARTLTVTDTPGSTSTATQTPTNTLVPTATMIPTGTSTATLTFTPAPTLTLLPTLTPAPTLTPVLPTETAPALVETEENYSLLVAKRGEDSLFVINQGSDAFPLDLLGLGEGEGRISGPEWSVPALLPGECVTAWKDVEKSKAPDVTCTEVGLRLTREKNERFWKNIFGVYINETWVTNCERDQCAINIDRELPEVVTITATDFELLIAKRGEDSLFVINQSDSAFPLARLRLGEGDGVISGSEWRVPALLPGECVTAWKDFKASRMPDVTCTEVGPHLTREKQERFWKSAFGIYFDETLIANCDSNQCAISVSDEISDGAATAATTFELLIATQGEDSLFVVNQGETDFPLTSLLLGDGRGAISGAEWGVDVLEPEQCVAVWKDGGNPRSPAVECDLVGARLTRDGPNRFWKSSFKVFYGQHVEFTCSSERCPISMCSEGKKKDALMV
jgi:serine/threonine protein kinase